MPGQSLADLFFAHEGNVVDKWEQYLSIYEGEFHYFRRDRPIRILEIGVQNGGSLELWTKLFPPGSEVVGLDVDPRTQDLQLNGCIRIIVADINDPVKVEELLGNDTFDIIIDDGSHRSDDIKAAFGLLFPRLDPGGLFIAEDLHASYWAQFGGGLKHPGSIIEFFKSLVDALNTDHFEDAGAISPEALSELTALGKWTGRISFYDSVVVVQKLGAEKVRPFCRVVSGVSWPIVNPVDSLIMAPLSVVENVRLGTAVGDELRQAEAARATAHIELQSELLQSQAAEERLRADLTKLNNTLAEVVSEFAQMRDNRAADGDQRQLLKAERDKAYEDARVLSDRAAQLTSENAKLNATLDGFSAPLPSRYLAFHTLAERASRGMQRIWHQLFRSNKPVVRPLSGHLNEEVQLIQLSGLFHESWYLETYPDVASNGLDPIYHYISSGAAEGRNPNPLFDSKWYLQRYPDVGATTINPLIHYLKYGILEGRNPSPYFDSQWYLERYPDVGSAGMNPLFHFLAYGGAESRDPNQDFPSALYREAYLQDATQEVPLLHFLRTGKAQGFGPKQAIAFAYSRQIALDEQRLTAEIPDISKHIELMIVRPIFRIYIEGGSASETANSTVSIEQQLYPFWTLVDVKTLATQAQPLDDDSRPQFLIWLKSGDVLHPSALYYFASAINGDSSVDLLYADEDCRDQSGQRHTPFYKPDWSPDYLESCNYLGSSTCVRFAISAQIAPVSETQFDFLLRSSELIGKVIHIRKVLVHCSSPLTDVADEAKLAKDCLFVADHLNRTGRKGTVTPVGSGLACYDAKLSLSSKPLISIVIPTAGKIVDIRGRPTDLINNCLDLVTKLSTYPNLEIIVVENGDLDETRRSALRSKGANLIVYDNKEFNVARKLNLGVSHATGEMILLLNDDIEPLVPDWIERLLEHFEKAGVGAVGAKLLYPDMKNQHVGVVLNSTNPDHVRPRYPDEDNGYFFSTCAVRNYLAVTGAVMLTPTALYKRVGGFTESLAVSYNDVDFCLKLREIGYRCVYAPKAKLIHFESLSRVRILDFAELRYFHKRWAAIVSDPFYNEEVFTSAKPTYEFKWKGRPIG